MNIGVVQSLTRTTDLDAIFTRMQQMEIHSCQLVCWDRQLFHTPGAAEKIVAALEKYEITLSAFWCGWEGRRVWDFYEGQITLGLVPADTRAERVQMLLEGSDFAKKLGAKFMVTHVGYIPENPLDPNYHGVLNACKTIADRCVKNGQMFLFETGQETPVTLRRALQDIEASVGAGCVGINLDPANLILYGKANPVDALEVFGEYVRGVHGKDGKYPTDGHFLGEETPLGEGKVNYPAFIRKLKEVGYTGDITIEREISGDEQTRDILMGKALLEKIIAEL